MASDYYHDDPEEYYSDQPRKKKTVALLCFSLLASLIFYKGVFAANINLNTGGKVEFGQGVSISGICDSTITLTPTAGFSNSQGAGSFYFNKFRLSNIDVAACNGVSFTLRAYGNSSSTPLTLFSTNTSAVINDMSTAFSVAANQSGLTLSDTGTAGAFTANFTTPVALASDVYKITVETSGNGTSSIATVAVSALNLTQVSIGDDVSCGVTTDNKLYCWGSNSIGQLGIGQISSPYLSPVELTAITGISSVAVDRSAGACALKSNGDVYCWGDAGNGRIGDGSGNSSSAPVKVTIGSTVSAVAAGGGTSCALLVSATVKCWGYNYWGQVGNGTDGVGGGGGGVPSVLIPSAVSGLTSVTQISKGDGSTVCAVKSTGTIHCWGYGTPGTLGDGVNHSGAFCWTGSTPNCSVNTPVQVSGISTASQVAVGGNHACALLSDATVKCWGLNTVFQVGVTSNYTSGPESCGGNNNEACAKSPVVVSGLTSIQQVAAGGTNSCALKTNGNVYCWGSYGAGMLGTNTNSDTFTPTQIAGISGASSVQVGNGYACALLSGGRLKCWGSNTSGQFGNGTTNSSATPS